MSRRESGFCAEDLATAVTTIIEAPKFGGAHWGIQIEPVSATTPLYQYNADASLIPASNTKLFTTAAALQIIGERAPQMLTSLEGWVTEVNRNSNNASADTLLGRIGGQHAVRRALTALGVDPSSYHQADGSGLSRSNRAQPSAFVTLLKGIAGDPSEAMFRRSLAVAGVNGTLRNRFRNTAVQGKVQAKTGTLQGVRALSGYLENGDYGPIAFSILVNQPGQSGQTMLQAIDQIVLLTARVNRCDP
jgi:D-alanyl-D-alanine carboxypeptidase/D-alanyl-D-alanine-endopeptidase (penicillin-binding protein 4)